VHVARLDPILERTFLRQNEDDFRALGEALIGRGRLPEAQQVLAMIKERELFGLTRIDARRTEVSLTALEAQWVERGEALLAEIRASLTRAAPGGDHGHDRGDQAALLRSKIDAAAEQIASWFDDLVAAFAAAEAGSGQAGANPPQPSTVSAPPPAGTALLQYLFAPDRRSTSIILTTGDLQREYRLPFADGELNPLVYEMRDAVQNRSAGFLDRAQRLYRMLVRPVAADLQSHNIRTLALSLDGTLRYLPVAALHDGERYLIEQFALVLTTGAVAAPVTGASTRRAPATGLPATGLPATGLGVSRRVADWEPLPGVREELAAVIRVDGQAGGVLPGVIRLDEAFTADALRHATSQANGVVHIASHFVFEAAHEAASYLLLGDGSRLTLAELAQLRFADIELVVLSACNTAIGSGHRQSGREIEGLGALVRHQGGRHVLATLWPVADHTTVAVMRSFYRNRYVAGLAAPEALRRAQLDVMRGRAPVAQDVTRGLIDPDDEQAGRVLGSSHPFYWAPYILMGEATDGPAR
jgi:CHAT domain-containing protein